MKIKAYYVYFLILLISGLIGVYWDFTYSLQSEEFLEVNGWFGFFFFIGMVFPYASIILGSYYLVRYFYRRKKDSRNLIFK